MICLKPRTGTIYPLFSNITLYHNFKKKWFWTALYSLNKLLRVLFVILIWMVFTQLYFFCHRIKASTWLYNICTQNCTNLVFFVWTQPNLLSNDWKVTISNCFCPCTKVVLLYLLCNSFNCCDALTLFVLYSNNEAIVFNSCTYYGLLANIAEGVCICANQAQFVSSVL